MFDKLVNSLAKGVGEVVASPLTTINSAGKALDREIEQLGKLIDGEKK